MTRLKLYYVNFFSVVYALYAYFNKGIAYSYLAEITLVLGLLLLIKSVRSYEIVWDRRMLLLSAFLILGLLYIIRGIGQGYALMDVIRDSFMFNYSLFILLVFLLKEELPLFKKNIFQVYKWFPYVVCFFFLISSYIPSVGSIEVFNYRLFEYKFGDMGVHLLLCTLFILNGDIEYQPRYYWLTLILIAYLFLVVSSYSRSGMVSYGAGLIIFFVLTKNKELKKLMRTYLKYVPFILLLAVPLYLSTKLEENFQGRKIGIDQLTENVTSLFSSESSNNTLNDNKLWRITWWLKIIDDTFLGPHFIIGQGYGMSLADAYDIKYDSEGNLRSPHNFHMTVLARMGVIVFFIWLYWIVLNIKKIRDPDLSPENLIYYTAIIAFLINASFDVYLEGPMGAMPFWIMVGLAYAGEAFETKDVISDEKQ